MMMTRTAGIGECTRKRCRRTTIVVCFLNLVAALYVFRSLYTSYSIFTSASPSAHVHKKTDVEIKLMEESIRIRQALEPVELVKLVKGLEKDLPSKTEHLELSLPVKQKLVGEVLQILEKLGADANVTEQLGALESWRRVKLQEIKRFTIGNDTLNPIMSLSDARNLKKALKSNLHVLLEGFGLYFPVHVTNKIDHDVREDLEEDDILSGPPMPPECHAELHTDYAGAAVRWGLTHHKQSPAECCQACLDHAKIAKPGEPKCNIWVYCPTEGGCHSPDKYEHRLHECWLKQDENPRLNFKDKYPESYRSWHPTAPVVVPWMSGVISS